MNDNEMEKYVFDSAALIDIQDHFEGKLRKLKPLVQDGRVKIPEGVFRELQRKTDKLYKIVEQWKIHNSDCIIQVDSVYGLTGEFGRIETQYGELIRVGKKEYPGFWKSPRGKKAADGQVVSMAKVLGCVVVSDDRAVRLACMLEGVPCISWTELVRQAGLSSHQLELF